jgi:hypothetical protein
MPHPFADLNAISSTDEIQFSITNGNDDYFPRVSTSQDFWVSPPRPIYHRPASYGMPSPVCSHCGGIAPRSGSTTVYGTPLKARSVSSTVSLLQVSPIPMTGFGLTQLMIFFSVQDLNAPASSEKVEESAKSVCLVERVHGKDDIDHMPGWKRRVNRLTPFFSMMAVGAYWFYFAFRIRFTIDAQYAANKVFVMAWIFIAVEMGVACKLHFKSMHHMRLALTIHAIVPMLLHQFWQCFLIKGRNREKLRVVGDITPTVDVFVTCCGEDIDLILDTTRAAAAVGWPPDRFRVLVLDDGGSDELRTSIEALAEIYPNVYYTARAKVKGVPHHFKAGNLNHGLKVVHSLPGGAGMFIAALDADMIPEAEWLRAIMAHLVIDPELALACPPQVCSSTTPIYK